MSTTQYQSKKRNPQISKKSNDNARNKYPENIQTFARRSKRLTSFIREHGKAVRSYALSLSRNAPDAEDLVQEALGRILKHVEYVDGEFHLRPLAFKIVKNCFIDRQRRKRRLVALDRSPEDWTLHRRGLRLSANCGILNELIRIESIETVRRAICRLRPRYREVLTLCDLRGQMYQQTATQLGIPIGTVRSSISRARVALRQNIESMEGR